MVARRAKVPANSFFSKNKITMKLRLSKVFMTAVIGCSAAYAATNYDSIDQVISVGKGSTVAWSDVENIPTSKPTNSYAVAKDGEGTLVYTGNSTCYSTIYVREGEMVFGDGETATNIRFQPTQYNAQGRYNALSVGGKNAVVRFDNANASCNETAIMVGGANGNGQMIIENGSHVDFAGGNVFVLGDISIEEMTDPNTGIPDGYTNATTAQPGASVDTAENLYHGTYSDAKNESDATFGRGDVVVKGGSYFRATYGNFWICEGSLTVDGKDTVMDVALNGYGYRTWLGLGDNSTSEINVTGGAQLNFNMSEFYTNNGHNSSTFITIDGENSKLVLNDQTTAAGAEKNNYAYFATSGQNSSTQVKVTNGGELRLENDFTSFGNKSSDALNRTVSVEIGEESSLYVVDADVYGGATITNDGTIEISEDGLLELIGSANVTNNGNIIGETWLHDGGTLTMTDGSSIGSVYLGSSAEENDATLIVSGNVTMTGSLEAFGGEGVEIVFTLGSTLNMNGNSVILDGSMISLSVDGTVDDATQFGGFALFSNYGEDSDISETTQVIVKGSDGSTTIRTIGDFNATVPEPTTATLSLLALAALAARRRRK